MTISLRLRATTTNSTINKTSLESTKQKNEQSTSMKKTAKKIPAFIMFYGIIAVLFVSFLSLIYTHERGLSLAAASLSFAHFQNKLHELSALNLLEICLKDSNASCNSDIKFNTTKVRARAVPMEHNATLIDIATLMPNFITITPVRTSRRIILLP